MKYRVLCIDNQKDDLTGHIKRLEQCVGQYGKELEVTYVNKFTDEHVRNLCKELRSNNPYDLFLIDYNLGQGSGGEKIVHQIRNTVHGLMVLYSAVPDAALLREEIYKAGIDGIYCIRRDKLGAELFSIIDTSLQKLFTPDYLRGIVVGSVSQMDEWFDEIIFSLLSQKGDEYITHKFEEIKDGSREFLEQAIVDLDNKISPARLSRSVKNLNLHQKTGLLSDLLLDRGCNISSTCSKSIGVFMDELNTPRISFAHVSTKEEGGKLVFKDKQGKVWDKKSMLDLLINIRRHYNIVETSREYFCVE